MTQASSALKYWPVLTKPDWMENPQDHERGTKNKEQGAKAYCTLV